MTGASSGRGPAVLTCGAYVITGRFGSSARQESLSAGGGGDACMGVGVWATAASGRIGLQPQLATSKHNQAAKVYRGCARCTGHTALHCSVPWE